MRQDKAILPDTILENFAHGRIHEEAVNVERVYFYKTDRKVNPKQEEPFWQARGGLPILLSAPHAVRHYRQKKIKVSDEFTGALVFLLQQLTNCYGLAVTKLYGGDPNFDDPCIYKDRIAEICNKEKIKLVLDLHGAARERDFDVDFGTNGDKTLLGRNDILTLLAQHFQAFGFNRLSKDHFAAKNPQTISSYVSRELGIPAVQIEINKQYRVPGQNPQGFHRLLGAMAASIRGFR